MKRNEIVFGLTVLLTASVASAKDADTKAAATKDRAPAAAYQADPDCVTIVQNTVAAAGGTDSLTDDSRKNIDVKTAGPMHGNSSTQERSYKVHVNGDGFVGTAQVTWTRGGCFISKLDLDGSK